MRILVTFFLCPGRLISMTEPIITVADELTEASKYAEVIDPVTLLRVAVLTGEELIRVLHPVFDEQIINYGTPKFGVCIWPRGVP